MQEASVVLVDPRILRFNDWNPNVLGHDLYAGLVQELRGLKARGEPNRKPLIVAEQGEALLVLDGEWTLRAALEVELPRVACVVVEADGFEQRRLTYVCNQHGKNDAVKLGRMFQEMLDERPELSMRELAKLLKIPLSTLFNRLEYAKLASLAKDDPTLPSEGEITRLPVRRVHELLAARGAGSEAPEAEGEGVEGAGADGEAVQAPAGAVELEKVRREFRALAPEARRRFLNWALEEARREGLLPEAASDGAGAGG